MTGRPYRVLFLLGLMRSGTTFFRNVLGANRSIQVLRSELNEFWTEVGEAPAGLVPACEPRSAADLRPGTAERVRSRFEKWFRSRNSVLNVAHRQVRLLRSGNERLIKGGRPYYLLNKSTHLHNKVGYLDAVFPDARFVFIVRDVHAQVFSLWQHLRKVEREKGLSGRYSRTAGGACWGFTRPDELRERAPGDEEGRFREVVDYWLDQNLLALESLRALGGGRFEVVTLEQVVGDLDGVLGRLDALLGARLTRRVDRRLVNNYTPDPLRSWREGLTARQKEILSRTLADRREDREAIASHLRGARS